MSQITSALSYHNSSSDMDKKGFSTPTSQLIPRSSSNTPSFSPKMDPEKYHKRRRLVFWGIRYFLIVAVVSVGLAIPIIVTNNVWNYDFDNEPDLIQKYQSKIVLWNLFLWLLISWGGGVVFDILIMAFPYIFRFISQWVTYPLLILHIMLTKTTATSTQHITDTGESFGFSASLSR